MSIRQRKKGTKMIVRETVKAFERRGFGMFVHFGIYSQLGQGEWVRRQMHIPAEAYHSLAATFCPAEDWAEQLVRTAKEAGCRYITLTTRHHDGYSLYDTRGLSDFDSMHSCGRDLVREFVEACRCSGLLPFFYHTLIDWEVPSYPDNWQTYMEYLRSSVELLCANYGPIGGLWFDAVWAILSLTASPLSAASHSRSIWTILRSILQVRCVRSSMTTGAMRRRI